MLTACHIAEDKNAVKDGRVFIRGHTFVMKD